MGVIGARRLVERVYLADPEEHPEAPSWDVDLSDAGIDRIAAIVSDACDRARGLASGKADGPEAAAEAARFERRVVCAFIGKDGYHEALAWLGGGTEPAPEECVGAMGDVAAALLEMFADRAGNSRLAHVGAKMASMAERARRDRLRMVPGGPAKGGKRGKGGKGRR